MGAARRFSLTRFDLDGQRLGSPLALGAEPPVAIFLHRDVAFVGLAGKVGWLDLATTAPALTIAVDRKTPWKAYDLFVADGDRVLAIDDEVTPFYADWFEVADRGPPERRGDWSLPSSVNGHYAHADLVPRPDGYTLYAAVPYVTLSGSGQSLVRLAIRGDRLEDVGDAVLNSNHGALAVLGEHDRERVAPLDGAPPGRVSAWTGLAALPAWDRVFLAAGPRGVLAVPLDFSSDATPVATAAGGSVLDVARRGDRLVALVGGPAPALVVYAWQDAALVERARHRLDREYHRILR